jgi:hypothetical protein
MSDWGSPEMYNLAAMVSNQIAGRRAADFENRQGREFDLRQALDQRKFQENMSEDERFYQAQLEAQKIKDANAAYAAYLMAQGGNSGLTPLPSGTPGGVETGPKPSGKIDISLPPPITGKPSYSPKPPMQSGTMPSASPLPLSLPPRAGPDTPPPGPGSSIVPYDISLLAPPPGLSGGALFDYNQLIQPYADTAMQRRFTGEDTREAAETAARNHFFDNYARFRTMTPEDQAKEVSTWNNNIPSGADPSTYLTTLGSLFNVTGIPMETQQAEQDRLDADNLTRILGETNSIWTLSYTYRHTPEQIAAELGKPIERINEILGQRPRTFDEQPVRRSSGSSGNTGGSSTISINFENLSPDQQRIAALTNPNMAYDQNGLDLGTLTSTEGHRYITNFWEAVYGLAGGQDIDLSGFAPEQQDSILEQANALAERLTTSGG